MAERREPRPTIWRPIWAMLHAFPLALFTTALVTDLAYVNTSQIQWSSFSIWLIAGGLFMGGFAILAAMLAVLFGRTVLTRRRATLFAVVSVLAWLLAFLNALIHSRDGWTAVWWTGLALSVVVTVLITVASWIGHSDTSKRVTIP
ncbi:hypothetical protein sos41_32690 [Alphaproteobacteria bacterium SO-S41]|nr:hypothetical protein sos41_32690 [Alphaproteobacteria bacterium SO-S41]